jgi:predicted RND superfamily exporter protein
MIFNSKTPFLLIYVALIISGIIWTQNLNQKNEETIFLTREGQQEYQAFLTKYTIRPSVIAYSPDVARNNIQQDLDLQCDQQCSLIDLTLFGEDQKSDSHSKDQGLLIIPKEEVSDQTFKEKLKIIIKKDASVWFTGVPYTNILLDKYSQAIKKTLFPSLFAGVFLLTLLYTRHLLGAIFCFIPSLAAASISLVVTKVFYGHSNLITSIVPLLTFVIQLSMSLHLYETSKELKSMTKAIKHKKEPIFLMIFTTCLGFGSLMLSSLEAISQFGLLSCLLIFITTITTLIWVYIAQMTLPGVMKEAKKDVYSDKQIKIKKFLKRPFSFKSILIMSLAIIFIGGFTYKKIPILTDATVYFPKSSKVKERINIISKRFGGTPILEVTIPLSSNDQTLEKWKEIERIEEKLSIGTGLKVISSNTLVKLVNLKYSGQYELPNHRLSYLTLKSKAPIEVGQGYPLEDSYRITILGSDQNIDTYEPILKIVQSIIEKSGYQFKFNGLYFHLMSAQKQMIMTLFKSFLVSLILISLTAFLYYKSLKIFSTFMLVNLLPVFASFPLFYLFDLSFNIATVMTYSISLGLIVDSSFHIIHALRDTHENTKAEDEDESKDFYFNSVIKPIVAGNLLLSFSFSLFSLNHFLPIWQFGLCLSIIIFLGLIVDLKVLPALVRSKDL